ncbi:hypothetical protein TeGR_g3222, partial [Tetraparma gracilis]
MLPPPFLPDIALHIYSNLIKGNKLFASCKLSTGIVRSISMLMQEELVVEHDWVIKDNPTNLKWYSIKSGKIEVMEMVRQERIGFVSPSEHVSFGEEFLFVDDRIAEQQYHARAMANCILITLDPGAFRTLEPNYEEEFRAMREFVLGEEEAADAGEDSDEADDIDAIVAASASAHADDKGEIHADATVKHHHNAPAHDNRRKLRVTKSQTAFFKAKLAPPNTMKTFADEMQSLQMQSQSHHQPLKKLIQGLTGQVVFEPNAVFQTVWNMLILFFVSWNCFMVPFRAAFSGQVDFDYLIAVDYLGDFFFLLDSRLRFTSFAFFEGDTTIVDREKIRNNYRQHLVRDAVSIVPIEILCLIPMSPLSKIQAFGFFRSFRLLRARQFSDLGRSFDLVVFKLRGANSRNELKVIKLLALIIISGHFLGCMWFFIAFLEESNGTDSWADCRSPIPTNHLFGCPPARYLDSFEFDTSVGLNTTGVWMPRMD